MKASFSKSRGAAMIMAIVVLGLLASVFASLTVIASQEFTRSRDEVQAAQTEQLHLAAIVEARSQLQRNQPRDGAIAQPAADITVTLTWQPGDQSRSCVVSVVGGVMSSRRLSFSREDGNWMLQESLPVDAGQP
jgi:type II secretory pathway component PulK